MSFRQYRVSLEGTSPLLMHADDLNWRAGMDAWLAEPENQRLSKAGDDRFPAWRWLGYCYHDAQWLGLPSDNLMTMLREGGAKVALPGKRGSFKSQSQSGLVVNELLWPLETAQGRIKWEVLRALQTEEVFAVHEAAVQPYGFSLFLKAAKVGRAKHVRVRPRFDTWCCQGTIAILDDSISARVFQSILDMAGTYCGLGDWRPSAPSKPGPWGRFVATIEEL